MPLTRLDNLITSKTGKYIYVSPDDFNASDALDNRGNTPLRPFVTIQRAFLEVARYSYVPGVDNDRFDQFTILLAPGTHYIDNRPGDLTVADIPIFNYDSVTDQWNDTSIFDLGNPNNVLYRFNGKDGGATIPRGTSLVGTDLRRTQVRALYIPDPADKDVPRTALFNVTGGCYFWQFTILDGNPETGPLSGKVYSQPNSTQLVTPVFSHHKMTNFVFADKQDLSSLYRKISKCFSKYQQAIDDVYTSEVGIVQDTWVSGTSYAQNQTVVFGGEGYKAISASTNKRPDLETTFWERLSTISREFDYRIQENRIVGPLADTIQIDELIVTEPSSGLLDVTVRTKINHNLFPGQYVAVANTGLNANLEGVFQVLSISATNPKEFIYRVVTTANAVGLIPGATIVPDINATIQAEVDSVESASPYVFNVSIRSTWGICGIWADGRKATGFKSMVIAQYTGVSLQKDDRAFIRYDEFTNTWNQAPLTDAFATTPYHIKGDAYWKDDWRNFHVRASDDSFIQNVSIFAVGFADHFLLESGGDMSITNSNSNFGNTSMHSKGYKGFAFNQDKGGYITDIIPPQKLSDTAAIVKTSYYPVDVQLSKPITNTSKLYLTGDKANNYLSRPAVSINGYRLGARTYISSDKCEKLYSTMTADQSAGETGPTTRSAVVYPQGFKRWAASVDTLSPANLGVGDVDKDGTANTAADLTFFNLRQDAANLIDANKTFIQAEAFGYILEKYPYLQNITYVNPNITADTGRYRDARNLILSNRQEIIDYAYNQMIVSYPTFTPPSADKCKRDIGLVIDALAADLYDGGNVNMLAATKAYFNPDGTPISNGLVGEETQSIFAFNRARDWAKKAISNLLSNTSLLPVTSLTASGTTITVTCSANHGLTSGQDISVGGATQSQYNVYKAKVLATGLTATQFKYTVASAPATSPATGAFYVSTVTIDPQNATATAGRFKDTLKLINSNRQEIIDTAFSQMQVAYPSFTVPGGNNTKCKRDIGYIVDSIAQDLFWGGNEFTVAAVKEYFTSAGAPLSNGLVGEETQSVFAFNAARNLVKQAITNQLTVKNLTISAGPSTVGGGGGNIANTSPNSCADVRTAVDNLFAIVTGVITAGNLNSLPPIDDGTYDCANVRSTIDSLFNILTGAIKAGNVNNLPSSNPGPWSTVSESSKCRRDIGYIVEAVTSDLRLGGNENTVNAAQAYYTGTSQYSLSGTISSGGVITGLSDTSRLQAGQALSKTSGAGNFGVNPTILSVNSSQQITVAITSGSFTAGSISFIANGLDYIQNERVETLDAYDYVRNLAISSMRNHNTYMTGTATGSSPIITVPSTNGLAVGMKVRSVTAIPSNTGSLNRNATNYNDELEQVVNGRVVPKDTNYTDSIPSTAYIMKIGDGTNGLAINQVQLGTQGSKFDSGIKVNAKSSLGTNTPIKFFFQLDTGIWANALKPAVDLNVTQDYNYSATNGECATVVEAINTYFTTFNTIINNGIDAVVKVGGTVNTTSFAQRATLFTLADLSSGSLPTDPHHLETGTPIRLVPRAKDGATVDKRLIRLPKGFDTNTVYYVIAPGRKTDPYDYSGTTRFDASTGSLQNLMLASSVENAAAGIYIYSSETQSVDENVIIDVYQYVLDVDYSLNQYTTRQTDGETFETEGPHVFDVPTSAYNTGDNQKYQAVFVKAIGSNPLPSLSSGGTLSPNREYYVRYFKRAGSANRYFKLFDTLAGAVSGATPLSFVTYTSSFYTLSNKKRSPLRFDPSAATSKGGTWYIGTDTSKPNTILDRIRRDDFAAKDKTPDTWFERIDDTRSKEDRVYRLRYVIPKYLKSVRDPLRGFVIKARNDSTRRLLPQKILLKPTSSGANIAEFSISNTSAAVVGKSANREYLGYTNTEHGPSFVSIFDPYNSSYNKRITTDSKVTFYVQSARRVSVNGTEYLQLTVFNIGIEEQGYKNKLFTTVKIDTPQGGTGNFVANTADLPSSNTTNIITWSGASSGTARVHAYFSYEGNYYMILKDLSVTSTITYSPFTSTTFTQGSVSAKLISAPNGGRSDIANNLYAIEGSNVYTLTPGDTLTAENGSYTIASIEDVQDFEGTYYIFDINTVRRRIYGQQDGIYYLTCMRGDIRPYPTGSGVGENFRNFKFSQPVSKLYPEFYKNDPEWYKQIDAIAIDPPPSISSADNYVHGLVTINDAKNSVTKEAVLDMIQDVGSGRYQFGGTTAIQSQDGGASAGSEARKISIAGNSAYPTEGKLYVELRRPSIARSGNHTFEYLGFGPGNYSTGFPARQEVVLTDIQDFYAQAKRENGGIVFYTGLNSNGDLYIGNRKINAITGEETFLESAALVSSADAGDVIGNFVTTFDGPVTFNDKVTFAAPNSVKWPIAFSAPIDMDVAAKDPLTQLLAPPAIKIKSNIFQGTVQDDLNLVSNYSTNRPTGDITLSNNRLQVAVVDFNARGFQDYSIRTATSQFTPDQSNRFGSTAIDLGSLYSLQTGDLLLKGEQVGLSGSLGWIYANDYQLVPAQRRFTFTGYGNGNNKVRITWNEIPSTTNRYTNAAIGITSSNYQIRITGSYLPANDSLTNKTLGAWSIDPTTFNTQNTYVDILLSTYIDTGTYNISSGTEPNINFYISNTSWKEVGVIGSESIRTETGTIGDYKLGINTVARSAQSAYATAFVSVETSPRANLDLVGNAFISGKKILNYLNEPGTTKTETTIDNAFLVGGDSATPNNAAVFRIATTNSGRVGINATNAQLDKAFVVIGQARISDNVLFQGDLEVDGGDITTSVTTGVFNLLTQNTFTGTLNLANYTAAINIGNSITNGQTINVGTSSSNSIINIGNPATTSSNISKINIGGAYGNNESQSYVSVNTKSFKISGDVLFGTQRGLSDSLTIGSTAGTVNFFNTITSTLNFGSAVSTLVMGGQGGSTKIRNSLTVNGSITANSNITLNGGLVGLNFNGVRSQLGSTVTGHTGSLTPPTTNNVDIVSIITTNSNQIDTPGNGVWGSTATNADYQQSFVSAGITLPALSGNYYYLPLKNSPTGANSISVNDFLYINSAPSTNRWPELVQVDELSQISGSGPYWIRVKRIPLGSFLPKPSNGHLDDTVIYKAVIQFNSTWITTSINTTDTGVSIAEIGGTINVGDYIIIDRISTDSNDANGSESGEAIKISSSSALVPKKFTINDGATPTPVTFFSVDSTNGNTIIGNPNVTSSNGNLSIYGGFTLTGGTPSGSSECEKLKLTDTYDTTFQVNTCTGDTIIGNQVARIELVPLVLNNNGTSSYLPSISTILTDYQNSTDTVVYAYSDDPTTINPNGPLTTVSGSMTLASSLYSTYYLPVQSISGFASGDLILVGNTTTGVFEIMQLSGDPFLTPGSMIVYRAKEGTGQITVTAGLTVRKIVKHPESANLIDIAQRTRTATTLSPTTPFLSAILDLGYIVQQKIDYNQYVRLVRGNYSTIFNVPKGDGTIQSGRLSGTRHLPGIDENRKDGALPFRRGNLTLNNDFKMIGGSLSITDSTNRSELFRISNDDGHAEHSASIGWIADVRGRGDFFLYGAGCPESVLISTAGYSPTFSVDSLGNARVLLTLGVTGVASAAPSAGISSLSIDNLGVNGANKFTIKQTGEIDSFGYTSFYTPSGARHTRYVSTTSTDDAKILSPNIVYMVNVTAQDTLILTLPSSPKTGDTVKIVEVGGNLSYQTTLVVRAPGTAVKVQGDSTGTLFGGRSTAYPSGELVVQTPNAAFTLVYLGSTDSNGQVGIPSTVQGWWLMEV